MQFRILLVILFICLSSLSVSAREQALPNLFNYGVASADPLTDRVIIWTKVQAVEPVAVVYYQVSSNQDFSNIISSGEIRTVRDRDYTAKADIEYLKPGTYYYYRFKYRNSVSITGRTKTLPKTARNFKVAFISCQNYESGFFTPYSQIVKDNPDLIIMLGDYIYEYSRKGGIRNNISGYAKDLESYRKKYKVYLSDPFLLEARSKIPMVSIWDDHEVMNDYSGKDLKKKDPQRLKDAYRAFFEYVPLREQSDNRIYRDFKIGSLVDFYLIDGRQYRDPEACANSININTQCTAKAGAPGRTYLGSAQKEWLLKGLTGSNSQWKVIGNYTLMMELSILWNQVNFDQWDGYKAEKDEILKTLKEKQVKNLVVFTGDAHTFMYGDILYNGGKIAPEIVTTSLTSPNPEILKKLQAMIPALVKHIKYINADYHGYTLAEFQSRKVDIYLYGVNTIENKQSKKLLLRHLEIFRQKN